MRYEVVIYFDGPQSKWTRSRKNWHYEDHGLIRIPIDGMPPPVEEETICRKSFRFQWQAKIWALAKLKDVSRCLAEIRPA